MYLTPARRIVRHFVAPLALALVLCTTLLALAHAHTASASTLATGTTRSLNSAENSLLNQINAARRAAGFTAVTLDNRLIDLARDRSSDMANRHYFDHYSPEGRTFLDTMRQQAIPFRMAGEIIAQNNYAAAQSSDQAFHAYMGSSEHKRILLMGNWRTAGVGQAVDGAGMYYYTVLFAQPR